MFENFPSMWVSVYSWFTPTMFFLLLNLMIGTIFLRSGLGTQKNQANKEGKQQQQQQPHITRAPSVLERLKSINFYPYRSEEVVTTSLQPSEEELPALEEETLDQHQNEEPVHVRRVIRSKTDTKQLFGKKPLKVLRKMKSASSIFTVGHSEEDEEEIIERHRPSTVKEGKSGSFGEDEEVDAKADDFINKFKNQLKLQRLDSIIRYKDMLRGGT